MNRGIRTAMLALGLALACVAALALPATALAHVPILEEPGRLPDTAGTAAVPYPHAQLIAAPTKSLAIYGYLAPGEHLDAYSFMVPARVVTQLQLLVPVRSGLEGFRPQLALYAESTRARRYVAVTSGPRRSFYEPFSAASFWESGAVTVTLVPGERYFFVVTPGTGSRRDGAYVIGVSGPEAFTSAEMLGTAMVLPQIWLGNWGGGPMRPGAIASITFAVVLVPVVIWLLVRWRRRRAVRVSSAPGADS